MAKAPRPGASRQQDRPFHVGFGGRKWTLHVDAITPLDVGDLRRAIGYGTREVFTAFGDGAVDLDIAGALVFLARRQEDRRITFEKATEGLNLNAGFTYGLTDDDEEDSDSPEA